MKRTLYLLMTAILIGVVPAAHADGNDTLLVLRQKLASQFALTKTTAAKDDIVTAGSVLMLHKDGLVMTSVASGPASNTYNNGRITHSSAAAVIKKACIWLPSSCPSSFTAPGVDRTFVAGEKFWLTDIDVELDSITFTFFTDQMGDARYQAKLKFPMPKGQALSVEDELKTIAQVITADGTPAIAETPQPPAGPTASSKQFDQILPPPRPVEVATKTIAIGDTKSQVTGAFGEPQKVVKLPGKEMAYYTDMKVTYVNEKVTSIDELATQLAAQRVSQ